jgi:hypothetical protein
MPSTTSKKTEITQSSELDLLKQKNAELENKLDLILNMLQAQNKPQETVAETATVEKAPLTMNMDNIEEIRPDKQVKIVSLCYGTLNLNDGRSILHFDKFGQTKSCLYSRLTDIVNNDSSFAENGLFYICDPSAVYHLGLSDVYSRLFNLDVITHICSRSNKEIEEIVSTMNDAQKQVLVQNIVYRTASGESFDLNKVNLISKLTKININDELAGYNAIQKLIDGRK